MADNLARSRPISPSGIRAMLDKGQEAAANVAETTEEPALSPDKSDPLPRPGDDYRVHSRHGNKPEMTLHIITKEFAYEGFSFADCERVRLVPGETPGGGPVLLLRFNGSVVTNVRIEGRHLHSLYHWIGLHLVSWIWEHPGTAEFADESVPLIKRITIVETER